MTVNLHLVGLVVKYIAIPVNLAVSLVYIHVSAGVWNLCARLQQGVRPRLHWLKLAIRESVDSLCRDGADMPRPPYIGKACTRPNLEDLSLFRYLSNVYESLCTQ